MVILHHTWGNAVPGILQPIHSYGWMGVDLFFVLSGYLIGFQLLRQYAASRAPSLADFYVRRGFRILPAYVLVLAIYCSAPSLREQSEMVSLWRFLSFTMNLGFDRSEGGAFSHAWSLCVEERVQPAEARCTLTGKQGRLRPAPPRPDGNNFVSCGLPLEGGGPCCPPMG